MEWYGLIFTIFFIIFTCLSIQDININTNATEKSLQPFSSVARFVPPPDTPDFPDNSEPAFKKCKMSVINSCRKYPNTTCTHFNEEIHVHYDDGAKSSKIKQDDDDEGYCMNVHEVAGCNLNHGDWALMKKSGDDNSYMKFCLCKYPGYIGNEKLFGPCETPFICDGQLENNEINVPLKQIQCKCKKNEINYLKKTGKKSSISGEDDDDIDEIPACKPIEIKDEVHWNTVLYPPELKNNFIDAKKYYDKNIVGNIGYLNELIDPCSVCPLTGQNTGGIVTTVVSGTNRYIFCRTTIINFGIPFRRSPTKSNRLLDGQFGPDGVLAAEWTKIIVKDTMTSQNFQYVINSTENNKKFYDALGLSSDTEYAIDVGDDNWLGITILPKSTFTPHLYPFVEMHGLYYYTYLHNLSLAHSLSANQITSFYTNERHGNLISTILSSLPDENIMPEVLKKSLIHHEICKIHSDTTEPIQYITVNDKIREDVVFKSFKFNGLCIEPLNKKNLDTSHWSGHNTHEVTGKLHYFVRFLRAND